MQCFPPTIVWRHRKENLKKCSLRGLDSRDDFLFYSYPMQIPKNLNNYILLTLDAPPLSKEDGQSGLFLLDATWRYAQKMLEHAAKMPVIERSIPSNYRTAYPRKQTDCIDPERGLASIEAIYAAYDLLGRDTTGLLDHYHWKNEFLTQNSCRFL